VNSQHNIVMRLILKTYVLDYDKRKLRLDFVRQVEADGRAVSTEQPNILIGCADDKGEGMKEWLLHNTINPFNKVPFIGDVSLYADRTMEMTFTDERDINIYRLFWEYLVKIKGFKQA
jgi:hypothetical protein